METVLINLEILSTIQCNEKLGSEGSTTFEVYKPGMYNSMARRVRGECRALNVSRLEQCIHHATAHLAALYHELNPPTGGLEVAVPGPISGTTSDHHTLQALIRHIRAAAGGLANLQQTYADDVSTAARIKSLTERIQHSLAVLGLITTDEPPVKSP